MNFSIKINNSLQRSVIEWLVRIGALISILLLLSTEAKAGPGAISVTSAFPTRAGTLTDVTPTLRLQFNQNISFDNGNIELYDSKGVLVQTFSTKKASGISIKDNVLSITPTNRLLNDERYYVLIDATAIWNGSSHFAGYSDSEEWYFFTEDVPLALVSSYPADDATNIDPQLTISLTFNKRIEFFNNSILIKNLSTDQSKGSLSYNDTAYFDIDGPTISFDFFGQGSQGESLYINAANGTIKTLNETEYWGGIADNSTLNFAIRDDRAVYTALSPDHTTTGVLPADVSLTITFDQDVVLTDVNTWAHEIIVTNSADDEVASFTPTQTYYFEITDNVVDISLTHLLLESNETYSVSVTEGFFRTADEQNWAKAIDSWTFTTRVNDGNGPNLVSRYPTTADVGVPASPYFTLTFDEPMNIGSTSGNYGLYRTSDDLYRYNVGTSSRIFLSEDRMTVTTSSPYNLSQNTEHYLLLKEYSDTGYPVLYDDDGNPFSGFPNKGDWSFKTYGPAEYLSISPDSGSVVNDFDGVITLTANHDLVAHTGYFRLMEYGTGAFIKRVYATDTEAQINGKEITIDFGPIDPGKQYYIHSSYPLKDQFNQYLPNFLSQDDWNFTSVDTQNPTLLSTDPLDGSVDIVQNVVLQANFNEFVRATGQGTITIYNEGGSVHQSYASDAADISYSQNTVQIDNDNLVKGNSYYVLISNDAIEDYSDHAFAGISSADDWSFSLAENQIGTEILLSNNTWDENNTNTTSGLIGTFSTDDPDTDETVTYLLVSGQGDTDNAAFRTGGGNLRPNIVFDYETKDTYSIRVQADDGNGGIITEAMTILVNNVIETGNDITTFSLSEENGAASVDATNHTVDIETVPGTDLSNLVATVELSSGASVTSHNLAEAIDFTSPVDFIVQAEDGTDETWTITVTRAINDQAEILSWSFVDQIGDAEIDSENATVTVTVATNAGSNIYSPILETPVTELSYGASMEREDGFSSHIFWEPEVYVVTAEDGTTKDWTVTVIFQAFNGVYTVGADEDFTNLAHAFNRLSLAGASGDITLELTASSHSSSAQLYENDSLNGYTLTIQPAIGATDVILTTSTTGTGMAITYDHVIIDGKGELTFKNNSRGHLFSTQTSGDLDASFVIKDVVIEGDGGSIRHPNTIVENSEFIVENNENNGLSALALTGTNSIVRNNKVIYGSDFDKAANYIRGFYISGGEIYNNFIYLNPTQAASVYGITFAADANLDVYHNTIVIEGSGVAAETVCGICDWSPRDSEVNIDNNLVSITRDPFTGGTAKGIEIYNRQFYPDYQVPTYSYNNIYVPSNSGSSIIVQDQAIAYTTDNLADLQNLIDGITVAEPIFSDVANADFTLTGISLTDKNLRGTVLASVTEDYFGTTRSSTSPSKGAHEVPNNLNDITVFELVDQTGDAIIDFVNHTVDIEVFFGTTITSLSPTVELSPGATVDPASGNAVDFTNSVTYTVTSEDNTDQSWTVSVTVAPPRTGTDILSFDINGHDDEAILNSTTHTISYRVPFGTSLTALTPSFTLSGGATSDPTTGVSQDFSDTVEFTVTAEDVSVDQVWKVAVIEANVAPTDLALSSYEINENLPAGSVVGTLSGTDPNGDDLVFNLVSGANSAYNYLFSVDQSTNELKTNYVLDYEAFSNAGLVPVQIRLQADDQQGETYEEVVAITILDLDEVPPVLQSFTPVDDSQNIELDATFTLTYDEHVVEGTGSYLLRRGDGQLIETLTVNGSGVSITDEVVTITPASNLIYDTDYYIEALAGVVTDTMGNAAPAIVVDDWSFRTKTLITNLSPADDATDVDLYADLEITFSETVVLQTGGSFEIFKTSNDEQVGVSWSFNGATLDGDVVTYDIPDGFITPEEDVYMVIRNGIEDQDGNPIDIIGNGTWNFTTEKVAQQITFTALSNKTYGDAKFSPGATTNATGLAVSYESSDPTIVSVIDDTLHIHKAGTVNITARQLGSSIYEAAVPVIRSLTIEKAELSVTVDDEVIEWGDAIPAFNISYGTFQNGDDANDLDANHIASTIAEQGSTSGNYDITISTELDSRYSFILNHGTLTINNNTPSDILFSADSINENNAIDAVIAQLSTTDDDSGQSHAYSLVAGIGDNDNGLFYINDDVLYTSVIFDHESVDTYSIRVETDDQNGGTYTEVMVISIADVNEAPTDVNVDGSDEIDFNENTTEGTVIGTLMSEDVDDGDSYQYELVTGTGSDHNGLFMIELGTLKTNASFNHEEVDELTIRIRTTDSGGLSHEGNIQVFINDVPEAPTGVEISAETIPENNAHLQEIGTLTTVDEDESETYTYSFITGDNDNALFDILDDRLRAATSFNFEGINEPLKVEIETNDGNRGTFEQTLFVEVTDLAEAPTEIELDSYSVDESEVIGTVVSNISAIDQDFSESFTYALVIGSGDSDNGSFDIVGDQLVTTQVFDFESGKTSYAIRIGVTDKDGLTFSNDFAISINDIDPQITSIELSDYSMDENLSIGTSVGTLSTSGEDLSDNFTYSLISGIGDTDNTLFMIDGDQLKINDIISFETKGSLSIRVQSDDGAGIIRAFPISLTVIDLNDSPTDISLSSYTIDENNQVDDIVATLTASDEDDTDTHTFSLVAGEGDSHNDKFEIVGAELKAMESFDFESLDELSIRIKTDDGNGGAYEKEVVITVNDVFEMLDQTITFDSILDYQYGEKFVLSASASSGLGISYDVVSGPATLDGDSVEVTGIGNITISADQAGNNIYNPAAQVTRTFTAQKANQEITFGTLGDMTYGDQGFMLTASASSGLEVEFSIVSGNATLTGDSVSITGAGEVFITADQSGDDNYLAATQVTQSFNVAKAEQSISFEALDDKIYADEGFVLSASASSGLEVEFSVVSGNATINDDSVSITGAGEVVIAADQSGDDNYHGATQVTQSFNVDKADQTITFEALDDKTYGNEGFVLSASASSGLEVEFSVVSGNATLTGDSVSITGAGEVIIAADQSGDDNYHGATQVTQSFNVSKADQTITFEALDDKTYGDEGFVLSASASSGLEVEFSVVSGNATINDDSVSITGAGEVVIAADQSGDDNYHGATQVTQSFNVSKADQTITFEALDDKTYGNEGFVLSASASSGLEVEFSVVSGNATLTGDSVSITGAGEVIIAADQSGDDNYNTATQVVQTFDVSKAQQLVIIEEVSDKLTTDADFEIDASASSGLAISFEITGPATMEGSTVSLTGEEGEVEIVAFQSGNDNYFEASDSISFNVNSPEVNLKSQTISLEDVGNVTYGDEPLHLKATASSGLSVTMEVTDGPGSLSDTTLTILGAGIIEVTISQGGNNEYEAISEIFHIEVARASQTISLEAVEDKLTTDEPFELVGISSAGLSLTYLVEGPATIAGSTLTLTGQEGEVFVTAIQGGNENYLSDTASLSFMVQAPEEALGLTRGLEISVYPNPATDFIMIENLDVKSEVSIISLKGKTILTKQVTPGERLDVSTVNSGIYLITTTNDRSTTTTKILIQR
jgi:methionine-rich copper-binding protein CopC